MATNRDDRDQQRDARAAARDDDRSARDAARAAERAERDAQRESDRDDRDNARGAERDARNNGGDDFVRFDISRGAPVNRNLGAGDDVVEVRGNDALRQVRVTFTSAEVGNGNPNDAGTLANQDGGLAVRVQAEDGQGNLTGAISRFDDEGIEFTSRGDVKFDVRDLTNGAQRGDFFDVVRLGTIAGDVIDESGESESYYINAGMGDDVVTGGNNRDFLVGGGGNDTLTGNAGDDSFIGGGGVDRIFGGEGNDTQLFNVATDGADQTDLGAGNDAVRVTAPGGGQVRLTFTSGEVGNGNANDSNTLANQDGGLAVRFQTEGPNDTLTGPVARFDDEGINFVADFATGQTFEVRDLPTGVSRGNFQVVRLGTGGADTIDDTGRAITYYTNAGAGDDTVFGGTLSDFLVGGAGNDRLNGREGDDRFIGGGGADVFEFSGTTGNDTILDFASGTDKIDLRAFGINASNVTQSTAGGVTTVFVDTAATDFTITLSNGAVPVTSDFVF